MLQALNSEGLSNDVKIQTSKAINTLLAIVAILILFGIALFSYTLFYYFYIPEISISKPLYFQFDVATGQTPDASLPFADALLLSRLSHNQLYDVTVEFSLPLSEKNISNC